MRNDQIRQNIYIVENIKYYMTSTEVDYKTYFFADLKTVNGNPLPKFTKPPYLIGLAKEESDFKISNINNESFDFAVHSYYGNRDLSKPFLINLIVVENK